MQNNLSEVACLREQIETQLVAMRRGLSGLAAGTARHAFISARMERVGTCQERLAGQLGEDHAALLVCEIYDEVMNASDVRG